MADERDLMGYEDVVYYYGPGYDDPDYVSIDDVIQAGIKALGIEDKFQFVGSDMKDCGHF